MENWSVLLHPLCIATICDHYTRVTVSGTKLAPDSLVIGLILGSESGTSSSFNDVCDLIYTLAPDGSAIINETDTNKILMLRTAVYVSYRVVGWYAVTSQLTPAHSALHASVARLFKANPPFLVLSPDAPPSGVKQLPIRLFSQFPTDPASEGNLEFKLESSHLEKIALDEVTKRSMANKGSGVEVQNQMMQTSVQTLGEKVDAVLSHLQAMRTGRAPINHEFLRRANKLCRMLQNTVRTQESDEVVASQADVSLVVSCLSASTKAAACITELSDVYAMLFADRNLANY